MPKISIVNRYFIQKNPYMKKNVEGSRNIVISVRKVLIFVLLSRIFSNSSRAMSVSLLKKWYESPSSVIRNLALPSVLCVPDVSIISCGL